MKKKKSLKQLRVELEKVIAAKKPELTIGDYYTEKRREDDEMKLRIEIARLEGQPNYVIDKLRRQLEFARYTGD